MDEWSAKDVTHLVRDGFSSTRFSMPKMKRDISAAADGIHGSIKYIAGA